MKRALVFSSVVVVAFGLLAGFFLWLRQTGDTERPESTLASALVELGFAVEVPAGPVDPNGPIFFSLGLASPRVINLLAHDIRDALDKLPNLTIGSDGSPWWSGIRLVARTGDDEQELSWTPLLREAEPVADLSDGLGRSIRAVVNPGEMRLHGAVLLQARMTWNGEMVGSNELDLAVRPESLDASTKAALFAKFHLEMGNLVEAQRSVEELVRLQPRAPRTHALRACVLEEASDLAAAQRSWVRAIELLPEDIEEPPEVYLSRLRAVEARLSGSADAHRSR